MCLGWEESIRTKQMGEITVNNVHTGQGIQGNLCSAEPVAKAAVEI